MSDFEVFKENVSHFINSLQNFRIKCKFCVTTYMYDTQNFKTHLYWSHLKYLTYIANKNLKKMPETYFARSSSSPHCVICKYDVQLKDLRSHLKDLHTVNDIIEHEIKGSMIAQYGRDDGNRIVFCNFCREKRSLFINYRQVYEHIETYHKKELCDIICSLKHSLPLELDARCMPPNIANKSDQHEEYIELKENFLAECKICKQEFTYVDINYFRAHLFDENKQLHEKKFIIEAEKYRQKTPERYIFKLKCLICLEFDATQSIFEHLMKSHSVEEVKNYEIAKHTWEYCSKHADFAVQCNFCLKTVTLTISKIVKDHMDFHMKQLARNKEEIHHTAGLSQTDTVRKLPVPSIITNESKLWENYTKLQNFQAKCQFCDFQDSYINVTKFNQHVEKKHNEIIEFEKTHGKEWPGIYFKHDSPDVLSVLRCLICTGNVMYQSVEDLDKHLRECHLFNKDDCYHYNYGWVWKYCNRISDLEVKCNNCGDKICLEVELSHLKDHIENIHLTNHSSTQEMHDTTGTSGSQLN